MSDLRVFEDRGADNDDGLGLPPVKLDPPGSLAALLGGETPAPEREGSASSGRRLEPAVRSGAVLADELRVLRDEIDALRHEVIDLRQRLAASGERTSAARYLENEHVVALREKLSTLRQLVVGR
jgi:hypothetical protein